MNRSPESMTPVERRREIAELLARGYLRHLHEVRQIRVEAIGHDEVLCEQSTERKGDSS